MDEFVNKKVISNIGSLLQKGQFFLAQKKIEELIFSEPNNLSYRNILAIIYARQKKFKDSIIVLKKIIKQSPKFIDAYINLGNIYNDLNQLQDSENCFKQVIMTDPNHTLALANLASLYDKQNSYEKVLKIYLKLIKINPNNLEVLNNYSGGLIKLGRLQEAKKVLKKVLKLDPKYINAIINLGVIYKDENNFKKAIENYTLAINLHPGHIIAHYNLGNVYENHARLIEGTKQEVEKLNSAIFQYKKAIKGKPAYPKVYYNLGSVFDELGQTSDAILSYKQAIKHDPKYHSALYNLGRAQLALGDFKNGWRGYELREGDTKKYYERIGISKEKIWDGKQFNGPLIIHAEQGIGDEVLYSSMFPDLLKCHKNLVISTDERLISFFQRSFPTIQFITKKKGIKLYNNSNNDAKYLLGHSMGKFFRNSLDDFKQDQKSWLIPDEKRVEEFKKHFSQSKKIKVGLCWRTSGIYNNKRNVSLIDLAKIFPEDNFEIINLQYGDIESDKKTFKDKTGRELIYFDHLDYTKDLEGLAGLMCNCDLVVAIGGFTASFASVLNKTTWAMVPALTDWVWHSHSNRTKSLWFPKIRIFRQKAINEWEYVFDQIKSKLKVNYA